MPWLAIGTIVINHRRLSEQLFESQTAIGRTKLPEEVFGKNFTIRNFIEASRNCILDFLHKKAAKIVKTINAHAKSTSLIYRTFKKLFIS
jgi:hypothetical protein